MSQGHRVVTSTTRVTQYFACPQVIAGGEGVRLCLGRNAVVGAMGVAECGVNDVLFKCHFVRFVGGFSIAISSSKCYARVRFVSLTK